ncbi:MAG: PTS sugar transporter subunit IIB [Chloroflexi bacterium]|nr:PTS sugar transporter subunit IIB [Chloroflexota bacterium]
MIKIAAVCGMGLGSGLLVKMGIERVLKREGFNENVFNVEVADISTAKAVWPDIFVTSTEFATRLRELDTPVVEVFNLFDEKEIAAKLMPVFREIVEKKGK